MTEEQERTAFEAWHCGLYRGRQEEVAYAAWKARAALSLEASRHHIIAEFLENTGQYVTNDASRDAAIADYAAEIMQWAHIFMVRPEGVSNYDEVESRLKEFVTRSGSECSIEPATFWARWNQAAGPLPDFSPRPWVGKAKI